MKTKVLCICAKGMNRSKYLAGYLRRKGYSAKFGGVEPYENPEYKWNPVSQKKIDWADVVIVIRKRLVSILKKNFKVHHKTKIILLNVTDSQNLIPSEFKHLRNINHKEFNKKWTYPQLRKAIGKYLPLKK